MGGWVQTLKVDGLDVLSIQVLESTGLIYSALWSTWGLGYPPLQAEGKPGVGLHSGNRVSNGLWAYCLAKWL
jgi:hypothetical protein